MSDAVSKDVATLPEAVHPDPRPEARVGAEAQAELSRQFEAARQLGRTIVTLTDEREAAGLTPYLILDRLPEADRAAVADNDPHHALSQADVDRARRASLGLSIEATAQVAEATIFGPQISEQLGSLEHLHQALREGHHVQRQALETKRADVLALTRGAVARRLRKPAEHVVMRDEDLLAWFDQHYQTAEGRLSNACAALKRYLDISPH